MLQVDIRVVTVETHLAGRLYPGSRADILQLMAGAGYTHLPAAHRRSNTARDNMGTQDDLFVRNDVTLVDGEDTEAREEL